MMARKKRIAAVLLFFAVAWMEAPRLEAQQPALPPEVVHYADMVLYNGKILTADEKFNVVEALAIRDGRFLAVGPSSQILPLAGPNTWRLDLRGKTVTPGIFNMHGGSYPTAILRYWGDKFLPGEPQWRTKEQALAGIQKAVAKAKPGDPVFIPRAGITPPKMTGGDAGFICNVVTLQELDAISANNPVFFIGNVNQTVVAVNSKAAGAIQRFLPQGVSTPFVKPNNVCVGGGASDLDGILSPGQWAGNDFAHWYEPADNLLDYYRQMQREDNAAGIVLGLNHMAVPLFNGIRALWERGEMTMRFRMPFPIVPQFSGHSTELPDPFGAETLFRRWANLSHIGDNMLRVVGIRVPAVGGNQSYGNTWTLEPKLHPYPDAYGNPAPYGGFPKEQEAMEKGLRETFRGREALIQACRFGWDAAADHTLGDRAYREVIKAFQECRNSQVVKRPNQRLSTAHTPMSHPDDIKLAAKLGVRSVISTGHAFGTELEESVYQHGTERMYRWAPIKTFLQEGIHPTLEGTFWTPPRGSSAFYWIAKSITRKDDMQGRVWNSTQALTRQEALWASTRWSADQLAEEKDLGSIEKGKEADLIVIDKDYLTIAEEEIGTIKVLLTMVGGKIVYEAPGALR